MDASKSGLILADGIFEKDQEENRLGGRYPPLEDTFVGDPESPKKRPAHSINPLSSASILTKLEKAGEAKGKELLEKFNKAAGRCDDKLDVELSEPYELATTFANDVYAKTKLKLFAEDLSKIRAHVDRAYKEWFSECARAKAKRQKKDKGSSRTGGGSEDSVSSKAAKLFSSPVEGIVVTRNVEEIKASFAYKNWTGSFAFQVAFGHLCEIKARATKGGLAPCVREIDEMKTVVGSYIRAVEKSYND